MLNLDLTNCNNPRSNTALTDTDSRHSAWWGHHCILNSLGDEMRWLFPHHATNWLSSPLISASCPSLIHPTTAESSQYLWSLHDSELYWKYEVYRVKRNSERTVPCGIPEWLTVWFKSLGYAFCRIMYGLLPPTMLKPCNELHAIQLVGFCLHGCLSLDLSRVFPASHPMTAGIGSSLPRPCIGLSECWKWIDGFCLIFSTKTIAFRLVRT